MWKSETQKLKQELSNLLQGKEQVAQVAKLMTLKDNLQQQIFQAVIYRKLILFEDLGVNHNSSADEEVYAAPVVVKVHDKINKYVDDYGYKPPRQIYEPVTSGQPGIYNSAGTFRAETAETLKEMIGQVIEMEQLFQKQLLFTTEKKSQFY